MRPSDLLGKSINFYPDVARLVGGIKPALFLSQLLYWTGKQRDTDGWIYKTHVEFEKELAMTRDEQDSARRILMRLSIIEHQVRGRPPRNHYRVNRDKLESFLWATRKSDDAPICGKPADVSAGNPQAEMRESPNCYIEPENTSENTNTRVHKPLCVIPKQFMLTDADIAYAAKHGITLWMPELEEFQKYYEAKGTKWRDWHKVWLRWVDRHEKWARENPAHANGTSAASFDQEAYNRKYPLARGAKA